MPQLRNPIFHFYANKFIYFLYLAIIIFAFNWGGWWNLEVSHFLGYVIQKLQIVSVLKITFFPLAVNNLQTIFWVSQSPLVLKKFSNWTHAQSLEIKSKFLTTIIIF
jgi:hypothetical protein